MYPAGTGVSELKLVLPDTQEAPGQAGEGSRSTGYVRSEREGRHRDSRGGWWWPLHLVTTERVSPGSFRAVGTSPGHWPCRHSAQGGGWRGEENTKHVTPQMLSKYSPGVWVSAPSAPCFSSSKNISRPTTLTRQQKHGGQIAGP